MKKFLNKYPHLPFLLILWLVSLGIYFKTLSPSILYIDAGTMIAAAFEPGIPNPPGFPFYVMLAHLFTQIPWNTVLFRVQLLSVLSAAGVLTWIYFLIFRLLSTDFWFLKKSQDDQKLALQIGNIKIQELSPLYIRVVALATAFILGFSYQFWSQTLNTESYILTNLMMITLLGLVLTIPVNGKISTKRLTLGAVILGLAAGTNPTIVQSVPALVLAGIFFWSKVGLKRVILIVLIVAGVTLAVYSYLPIRASQYPFLNWGNPQTPELFWGHLRGEGLDINDPRTNSINGFTGSPQIFARSTGRYFFLLLLQFTPILLPFIALGIYYLFRKNWRLPTLLLTIPIVNLIFGGLYLSGNQESWFIASYVIFSLFLGVGLSVILKLLLSYLSHLRYLSYLMCAVLVLIPLLWWFPKLDRSAHLDTQEYADNLYSNLPKGAVVIGSGDFFNSLSFYEYDVVKRRPDVFPVVANMWYILPWYRDTLRHHRPDLMPAELEGMIKKDRLEEYNEVMNWYIKWLIDHGHPVYVTPMVFRETVLAGTDAGKYRPDPKKLKPVISGLAYRMLSADDLLQSSEDSFKYKFKDPKFYEHPPFYLERNYNAAYHLLLQEYGMSYVAMEDNFLASAQQASSKEEKNQDLQKADEYMNKAYDFAPFSVEVVNRKAIAAANKGDLNQAIKFFKEAASLDPGSLEVKLNLAKAEEAGGQMEDAKKQLQFIISSEADPQIKNDAQSELAKITGQQLSSNIPKDWKIFESKSQGFSFKYPADWKVETLGQITRVSLGEFGVSFYGGNLGDGEKAESWSAKSPINFTGKLDKKGLAQIPGFDATAAFWNEADGKQALEFVLIQEKNILQLRVKPVGDQAMKNLDLILSSIKFSQAN